MATVASRELRNNTRGLLDLVDAGETVVITVDGRPVASLVPAERRPSWIGRAEFVRRFATTQTDPGLAAELRDMVPDTTDDASIP